MTREVISSRQNVWFKRFRVALARHDEEIVVEGRKFVDDCLRLGLEPIAIAVDESTDYEARRAPLPFASSLFAQLTDTETSQGVVALFTRPHSTLAQLDTEGPLCVLDGVQDPGNVGTIIRLAVAFEAAGVVALENCADPFSPKVIRASAGTIFSTVIVQAQRGELLEHVDKEQIALYAMDANGATRFDSLHRRSAIVFGSEGSGVSGEIAARAVRVTIPTGGKVESLNVAGAAAIVLQRLFESRR